MKMRGPDIILAGLLIFAIGRALSAGWLWPLYVAGVLIANHALGAAVCAAIDDQDKRLLNWRNSAPSFWLGAAVTQLWPWLLWTWWRDTRAP